MKCIDIHHHFQKVGKWVNWDQTTDSIKVGDPEREVTRVVTVWNPTFDALREAQRRGAEFVIAHESVFVKGGGGPEEDKALPSEQEKLRWIQEEGPTVYRCHDVWDNFPEIGIRETWQSRLFPEGKIVKDQYPLLVTEIEPRTVRDLARHILRLIEPLGQDHVQVSGNLDKMVSRVATGTGVTPDPITQWKIGADVGVMTDDYFLHVREGAHAAENDYPMIFVNHGVAEEWGIENLSKYVAEQFPELEVSHISQGCPFQLVRP